MKGGINQGGTPKKVSFSNARPGAKMAKWVAPSVPGEQEDTSGRQLKKSGAVHVGQSAQ